MCDVKRVPSGVVGDVLVKFRYEERDVATALRSMMLAALRKRPDVWLAAIVLVIGLAVAAQLTSGGVRVIIAACAALVVAMFVAALVLVPKMMFRRGALRDPMTIDASDEGLTIIEGTSARSLKWDECARIERGARVIVIHHGQDATIVPRRAFRSTSRERAFLELVERHASRDMRALDSGKSTPSAKP